MIGHPLLLPIRGQGLDNGRECRIPGSFGTGLELGQQLSAQILGQNRILRLLGEFRPQLATDFAAVLPF